MYFISHSSEQKDRIAIPLHIWLTNMQIGSWIDKGNIYTGDQIFTKITESIYQFKFCIAIIDNYFINKEWTIKEIELFLTKEQASEQENSILPIFVEIEKETVYAKIPALANRAFEVYSKENLEVIKARIFSHFCYQFQSNEEEFLDINLECFKEFNNESLKLLKVFLKNKYYLSDNFKLATIELYNIGMIILNDMRYPAALNPMKNYYEYIKSLIFDGYEINFVIYNSIYDCTKTIIYHLKNKSEIKF